jgi:hypothetical protein
LQTHSGNRRRCVGAAENITRAAVHARDKREGGNRGDNDAAQAPDIVPALLMSPPNVVVFPARRRWCRSPRILLWLSILMPPEMTPVSTMPPLRKVLLLTEMPPAPMVPALVTPPLKVVWLTTMAPVLPLNVVG